MKLKPTKPSPGTGTPAPKPAFKLHELARDYIPEFNLSLIEFDDKNARTGAADEFAKPDTDTQALSEARHKVTSALAGKKGAKK